MSFRLTKEHVLSSFAPLAEIHNLQDRKKFFSDTVDPANITWTITGNNALSGTRHSIEAHSAASFDRLLPKLQEPIRFVVTRVIVDAEPVRDENGAIGGWWACVETRGEAVTKTGERYDNEYAWITRWNSEGRIVEIRSYFDTLMAEHVLYLEVPEGTGMKP